MDYNKTAIKLWITIIISITLVVGALIGWGFTAVKGDQRNQRVKIAVCATITDEALRTLCLNRARN